MVENKLQQYATFLESMRRSVLAADAGLEKDAFNFYKESVDHYNTVSEGVRQESMEGLLKVTAMMIESQGVKL
ncbi:hypothetical protein HNV12_03865 [Methanococcoides sp. SA1]|nr:hypothetical protein [Methanococcoides sp. SA1]